MIERRPMPPLGHFSLIRFERTSTVAGDAKPRPTDERRYA
jgi:hypothetical protein